MSNAERQARFRASHPGYNARYRGLSARARARKPWLAALATEAAASRAASAPTIAPAAPSAPAVVAATPAPEAAIAIAWLAA